VSDGQSWSVASDWHEYFITCFFTSHFYCISTVSEARKEGIYHRYYALFDKLNSLLRFDHPRESRASKIQAVGF
jgi:hypothetical protein